MTHLKQFSKETECNIQDGISPSKLIYVGLVSDIPDNVIQDYGGYEKLFSELNTDEDSCVIFKTQTK